MGLKVLVHATIILAATRICLGSAVGNNMRIHGYETFRTRFDKEELVTQEESYEGSNRPDTVTWLDRDDSDTESGNECDIRGTPQNGNYMANDIRGLKNGPGLYQNRKWRGGVIPYEVNRIILDDKCSETFRGYLQEAMDEISSRTCITFKPRKEQLDYVHIQAEKKGCFSALGRQGKKQILNLSGGCWDAETIIHELMHAVGIVHEHSRKDRNKYVKIHWKNIEPGAWGQFGILYGVETNRVPYDYQSIMHYSANLYSINKYPVITSKGKNVKTFGGKKMTKSDVLKIQKMYNCRPKNSKKSNRKYH